MVLIRPRFAKRYLQHSERRPPRRAVYGGFVGERALATDPIGDELHPGHVRLAGESWLAISHDGSEIDGDATVDRHVCSRNDTRRSPRRLSRTDPGVATCMDSEPLSPGSSS